MSTVSQNVNLYLPEFRTKKHWLDAQKTVLVAGAGVALMVIASLVDFWQLTQLRAELADKEQQHQDMTLATVALRDQYGVQTEDPALLEDIETLQEDLQSKQALLTFLEGRDLGNTAGFSEYLADLSRYHVQGLSLTQVKLTSGGTAVELAGEVLRPELVTVFLENLGNGNTYAGMDFEMVNIEGQAGATGSEPATQARVWDFQIRSLKQ